ncbi:MAG: hypothetical protein ABUL77_01920, partial [Bacteroidota bacterium]
MSNQRIVVKETQTMTRLCFRAPGLGLSAVVLAAAAGCGGGGTQRYPDAVAGTGMGGSGGNAGNPDGGGSGGAMGGTLGTGGSGGSAGIGGDPMDAGVGGGTGGAGQAGGSLRLLAGAAALLGPGTSCSFPAMPAGGTRPDQWCGAVRPGTAGTISLSVFNLTKAMAGAALTCAAGDTNCLVLNTNISADAPHGFYGETLIYYDSQAALAWRPGWTAGRVLVTQSLTTNQLASCGAGPDAMPGVICVKNTADATLVNLYAGRIAGQTGAALDLIEGISTAASGASFSTDFQSVIWSTKTTAAAPEVLKMQAVGDAATRRTVASDVAGWSQTPDGSRWLWLSHPAADTGTTTGTLQTAPYPAGTAPKDVQPRVVQYAPWSGKGVLVLSAPTAMGGDLKTIADLDNPTTSTQTI